MIPPASLDRHAPLESLNLRSTGAGDLAVKAVVAALGEGLAACLTALDLTGSECGEEACLGIVRAVREHDNDKLTSGWEHDR